MSQCFFCRGQGHGIKDCPERERLIRDGTLEIKNGFPYIANTNMMLPRMGPNDAQSGKEWVEEQVAKNRAKTASVNMLAEEAEAYYGFYDQLPQPAGAEYGALVHQFQQAVGELRQEIRAVRASAPVTPTASRGPELVKEERPSRLDEEEELLQEFKQFQLMKRMMSQSRDAREEGADFL